MLKFVIIKFSKPWWLIYVGYGNGNEHMFLDKTGMSLMRNGSDNCVSTSLGGAPSDARGSAATGGPGLQREAAGAWGKSSIMNYVKYLPFLFGLKNPSHNFSTCIPWNGDRRPIACLETNVYIKTIRMHLSHKTCQSLSTRQRRICLYTFNVKCVFVSYTVLKWPLNIPVTIIQHVFWLYSYIFRMAWRRRRLRRWEEGKAG